MRKINYFLFKQFKVPVYKPANGETIILDTPLKVYVDISEDLFRKAMNSTGPHAPKRFCPITGCLVMDKDNSSLKLISCKTAAENMGVKLHSITFSEIYQIKSLDWNELASRLRKFDPELQQNPVRKFRIIVNIF